LHQQVAEAAGRGGHEDHVVRSQLRHLEDAHGRSAGADHRDGSVVRQSVGNGVQRLDVRHRLFRTAAAGLPEVHDHPLAEPARVDHLAQCGDHSGDLTSGDHRQFGQGERAALHALADRGIDQVDARSEHCNADLTRAGLWVVDLLVSQVLSGTEGVQSNRVHDVNVEVRVNPRSTTHHNGGSSGRRKESWCSRARLAV
jgi:hypothetical protein